MNSSNFFIICLLTVLVGKYIAVHSQYRSLASLNKRIKDKIDEANKLDKRQKYWNLLNDVIVDASYKCYYINFLYNYFE